jgi:alkylation response protein AidB-like acyl-CoA dehydrogenase
MPDSSGAAAPPLDYQSLRAAAEAMVPVLLERAPEAEKLRRLPDETVADFRRHGLTRLCQPKSVGGAELPLDKAVDIVTVLARGCASSAWVCGIWCDHAATIGTFDGRAVDDIWRKDPDIVVSAGVTPSGSGERVEGGLRISGRWGWSSGCDFADWVMLSVVLPEQSGAPGGVHMCLVPRADFEIVDDWHVMGMTATGSKTVTVAGAFVPDYRILSAAAAASGAGAPGAREKAALYRLSRPSTVPFFLVAPALGAAEAALEAHVANIVGRQSRGNRVAEFATMQMHVAEASAEIDAARLLMMRDLRAAMQAAENGREWTMAERARGRRDQAYVAFLCRRAVDRLFTAAGGGALFLANDQQRRFRDVHGISAHISLNWDVGGTTFGRITLGLDAGGMNV